VGAGSCDVAVMVVAGYGVASLRVFGVRDSIERLLCFVPACVCWRLMETRCVDVAFIVGEVEVGKCHVRGVFEVVGSLLCWD
jgi:hypothetical protein